MNGESDMGRNRWGTLPMVAVGANGAGRLPELPVFERRAPEEIGLGANPHCDIVVRMPAGESKQVPVGMVSKSYRITQHHEVIKRLEDCLSAIPEAEPGPIKVSMTPNGERVVLEVNLGQRWQIAPDHNTMGLQVICRNSVDGSSALRMLFGWFRFVCSNGMILGVTLGKARMAHTAKANMDDAFSSLLDQLKHADEERENLAQWAGTTAPADKLQSWVDSAVAARWNSLAAARVWHICNSGRDVRFSPPFDKSPPSRKRVDFLKRVQGSPEKAANLFDVSQALSWVASRRSDVIEAEARQRDIGPLMEALTQ